MDSYSTGIIIRSRIQEGHRAASQERLVRSGRSATVHRSYLARATRIDHAPFHHGRRPPRVDDDLASDVPTRVNGPAPVAGPIIEGMAVRVSSPVLIGRSDELERLARRAR